MSARLSNLTTSSRALGVGLAVVVVVASGLLGGCRKQLFTANDERSPYARYDSIRGQDVPPYRYNEFGRRVPNLRARLTPKE